MERRSQANHNSHSSGSGTVNGWLRCFWDNTSRLCLWTIDTLIKLVGPILVSSLITDDDRQQTYHMPVHMLSIGDISNMFDILCGVRVFH
jgi:hypothetical protein